MVPRPSVLRDESKWPFSLGVPIREARGSIETSEGGWESCVRTAQDLINLRQVPKLTHNLVQLPPENPNTHLSMVEVLETEGTIGWVAHSAQPSSVWMSSLSSFPDPIRRIQQVDIATEYNLQKDIDELSTRASLLAKNCAAFVDNTTLLTGVEHAGAGSSGLCIGKRPRAAWVVKGVDVQPDLGRRMRADDDPTPHHRLQCTDRSRALPAYLEAPLQQQLPTPPHHGPRKVCWHWKQ